MTAEAKIMISFRITKEEYEQWVKIKEKYSQYDIFKLGLEKIKKS